MTDWLILKFGGTSVATLSGWQTIAEQVRRCLQDKQRPLLVCSALAGVTDQLQALANGQFIDDQAVAMGDAIIKQHQTLLAGNELGNELDQPSEALQQQFETLRSILADAIAGQAMLPAQQALLLSQGELLSTASSYYKHRVWMSFGVIHVKPYKFH